MVENLLRAFRRFTSFQIIILGFAGVIVAGALLLMLPAASAAGTATPFTDALFTSTSAVCVTGLVVRDSGSYWSPFGQSLILLLIQIGGLGVITMSATFLMLAGRNISLKERSAMQDALSAPSVGGIVRLTRFILKGTFIVELTGALVMLPVFWRDHGFRGIWMAVFHSVSAFCNAGFDILGTAERPYPSLTAYVGNPVVNITVIFLLVVGGLGFLTWDDIRTHRWRLSRYRMQSKVILATTAILLLFPAVLFFFTEYSAFPLQERILASLFQSATPRTAGFNTTDLAAMSDASRAVMILLMLVGGAPGSTAGGMKVTTLAVLAANLVALAALDDGILVVEVVELQLHELELRLLGEYAVEHFGLVVEGHAEVAHPALALELGDDLECAAIAVKVVALAAHGVDEVVVEVVDAAAAQLLFKERQHVLTRLKKAGGELVCQHEALARIARREAVADGRLALAVEVAVGGVEVGETGGEELVYHGCLLYTSPSPRD